jgi:hypothetical protein
MKVIERNNFGEPTGWQQGQNKMFFEKYQGGHFYLIEKPFKGNEQGTEEIVVIETELKFKDAKRKLIGD